MPVSVKIKGAESDLIAERNSVANQQSALGFFNSSRNVCWVQFQALLAIAGAIMATA